MRTQSLQEHQQDLKAIDTAIAQLSQLSPGTATADLAIKDTIRSFGVLRLVTQRCIDELLWEGSWETYANSWQASLDYFHSDAGVHEEEVMA